MYSPPEAGAAASQIEHPLLLDTLPHPAQPASPADGIMARTERLLLAGASHALRVVVLRSGIVFGLGDKVQAAGLNWAPCGLPQKCSAHPALDINSTPCMCMSSGHCGHCPGGPFSGCQRH